MVITADKNQQSDSAYHTLVKHIKCHVPLVMVNWAENFVFNDELLKLTDYVLIDYCEYGWDFEIKESHIWGKNKVERYSGTEWDKFSDWVGKNKPKRFFKRELLKKDVTADIKPIDYTCQIAPIPTQSKELFLARPVTACYYFGRSHEGRLRLHGDIWIGATIHGYSVADNIYYINGFMQNEGGKKYVSMHIPHYQRHPIADLLHINGMSKIGIAPHGAGIKTFRAAEVSANAVMLLWEDDLAWGAEWIHGINCLRCKQGDEIKTIELWANQEALYDIYIEGVKNWNKYRTENYINDYINPLLKVCEPVY